MELNYATKGVANAGLATGIVGTTLGALNMIGNGGGILGGFGGGRTADAMAGMAAGAAGAGLMNGMGRCSESTPVTRYDLEWIQKLMAKDQELAIVKSEQNTEIKIADVYERVMKQVNQNRREQDAWNTAQAVNNTHMSDAIAALQASCASITKLVVPNSAICPGWGPVTVAPQATGTVVG